MLVEENKEIIVGDPIDETKCSSDKLFFQANISYVSPNL